MSDMFDYKTLTRGDLIWVDCYPAMNHSSYKYQIAKFLGWTPANSYLGYIPRQDVVHYQFLSQSLRDIEYVERENKAHFATENYKHQNGLFGTVACRMPRSIMGKLTPQELREIQRRLKTLTEQFDV